MIILCFIAFLVAVVIIAVAIAKIQGSKFNTKVQAYSDKHVHKVLVNLFTTSSQLTSTHRSSHT